MTEQQGSRLFLDTPTSELRQGDICFDWPFPKWQLNGYMIAAEPGGNSVNAFVSLHSKGESLPLIICSHDCDLENPRSRIGFVVAPLLRWPNENMGSDISLNIISSYVPNAEGAYEHINLYPIKIPSDPPDWRVVDFSSLTSIASPLKAAPVLRAAKRFEMTDEARENFSNKLAAFFIRQN